MQRNGLRLQKLVNTLLDFSRIEAGRMQAVYEPTDLADVTAELASNFRSACERAGLRLVVDCPALPDPVYVDRDMWEKIVLNLLSNAFKFTFAGEITVILRSAGETVELAVRDTGTGIPAAEIPHLFERFYRVEGARGRTHEGTGIGLALVQELVKLHGGSVRVESAPSRGSTFIVSIPTGTAHLPADLIGGTRTLSSTALGARPYVEEALRWLPDAGPFPLIPPDYGAWRRTRSRRACPPRLRSSLSTVQRHPADKRASCGLTTMPTCVTTSGACSVRATTWRPWRTARRPCRRPCPPSGPGARRRDDATAGWVRIAPRAAG